MTQHNSLHTGSAAHAVLSALDGRLALAGEISPAPAGPGALDIDTGVMFPSPGGFAVSGTSSTSPWQYSVPAAAFVTTKGTLDGARLGSNDGVYLVSTIAPPASNSRYDVIYVMQQDADATISPDASTAPLIGVVNGTAAASPTIPAIPAGAYQLAHAQVFSTAVAGTSGANVTITQDWGWTSLRGTPMPFRNATEMNACTWGSAAVPAIGLRIDLGTLVMNRGSGWVTLADPSILTSWTAYTPAASTTSGAIGAYTSSGRYKVIGKTVFVQAVVTITTLGSAGGDIFISVPGNALTTNVFAGMGREMAVSGFPLISYMFNWTNIRVTKIDNTSPVLLNGSYSVSLTYEIS